MLMLFILFLRLFAELILMFLHPLVGGIIFFLLCNNFICLWIAVVTYPFYIIAWSIAKYYAGGFILLSQLRSKIHG
jgi:hypothetical protein